MSEATNKVVADALTYAREQVSDARREYSEAIEKFGAGSEEAADAGRVWRLANLNLRDMEG